MQDVTDLSGNRQPKLDAKSSATSIDQDATDLRGNLEPKLDSKSPMAVTRAPSSSAAMFDFDALDFECVENHLHVDQPSYISEYELFGPEDAEFDDAKSNLKNIR